MHELAPIVVDPQLLEASHAMAEPEVPGATVHRRGKVRTVFNAGPDHYVIVASDRLSAYDSVLPTPIPGKGAILSLISAFWMKSLAAAAPHHPRQDRAGHARYAERVDHERERVALLGDVAERAAGHDARGAQHQQQGEEGNQVLHTHHLVVGAVLPVARSALMLTGIVQIVRTRVVATEQPAERAIQSADSEPETECPTNARENGNLVVVRLTVHVHGVTRDVIGEPSAEDAPHHGGQEVLVPSQTAAR